MVSENPNYKILEKIKNGERLSFFEFFSITLNDLLEVDSGNVYYLEYACNNMMLSDDLIKEILNSKEALYIIAKNNHIKKLLKNMLIDDIKIENEDIFFETIEGDKKLIDLFLENCSDFDYWFVGYFKNKLEIVDYMIKYGLDWECNYLSKEVVNKLFTEKDGKFLIDKYISNNDFVFSILDSASLSVLLNYCQRKGDYNIFKDISEKKLLTNVTSKKTLLEFLLDRGFNPITEDCIIWDKNILDILIKKNRFDLLHNANMCLLFEEYSLGKSYFDLMVEKHKSGVDVCFEKINFNSFFFVSSELFAKILLYMAKNDIIGYVPKISSTMLLHRSSNSSKNVISFLLEMDRNLTISKILKHCNDIGDPNLMIALRSEGVDADTLKGAGINSFINYGYDDSGFSDKYISEFNEEYAKNCESKCPDLLNELRNLFYSDGKSDRELVDGLIISYTYLTSGDKKFAFSELKKIIEIKQKYPDKFLISRDSNNSYFSFLKGNIGLYSPIIGVINHEMTHALHYYLGGDSIPDNFSEVLDRTRNDPKIIGRISLYSRFYRIVKKELVEEIPTQEISSYFDNKYSGDKEEEIKQFLAQSKDEKKVFLLSEYLEDVLDVLLEKTYSFEEFLAQRKKLEILEVTDAILESKYDAFLSIGDIIDAIFMGKFKNGVLIGRAGNGIKGSYGHGIDYFSGGSTSIFTEMLADYGTIIKSKNSDKIISLLRKIVGDEIVDMLRDYYNKMLLSDVLDVDKDMEEGNDYAR